LLFVSQIAGRPRKEAISFRDACWIGLAQACAVLPGLSRSGATVATGLLLGNQREQVARFSFLMVILPVAGEAVLDLLKGDFSAEASGISPVALGVGFLTAFVTGMMACRWMIRLVKKGKLVYFACYCVAAGLFAIMYSLAKQGL
jgi:undecaprenyl-diphosphatase